MSAKQLRPGWRKVKFGNVVRQVKDKVDPETAGIERYVAGEHMDTDDLRIRRWGEVGDGYLGPAFTMRFQPGQVLYGSRRTYLRKVALADFDGICANTTFIIESATDDLLPEFLPYVMTTEAFHEHSIKQSKGSVNPYINFSDLKWYEFALPPLDEQKRTVGVLAACDDSSECQRSAAAAATALLGALRNEAFTSSSDVRPLEQTLDCIIDHRGKTPRKLGADFIDDGVPVISAMHVTGAGIDLSEPRFVSHDVWHRWMPDPLRPGDVLLTSEAPLGRTAVVDSDQPLCLGQRLFALRPQVTIYRPRFLQLLLDSQRGQRLLQEHATGSTVRGIRAAALKQVLLPVSPPDVQERFCAEAEALDAASAASFSSSTSLRTLRTQLLETFLGCENHDLQ